MQAHKHSRVLPRDCSAVMSEKASDGMDAMWLEDMDLGMWKCWTEGGGDGRDTNFVRPEKAPDWMDVMELECKKKDLYVGTGQCAVGLQRCQLCETSEGAGLDGRDCVGIQEKGFVCWSRVIRCVITEMSTMRDQ